MRTETFDSAQGLREGCVLSSTLFSIIIHVLLLKLHNAENTVYNCYHDSYNFSFLYLLTTSSSPQDLQTQLNCVSRLCEDLGLEVNIDETKVMVFRKGGYLGRNKNG